MYFVTTKITLVKIKDSTASMSEDLDTRMNIRFDLEIYTGDKLKDSGLRVKCNNEDEPLKDVLEVKNYEKTRIEFFILPNAIKLL